MAKRVLLCDAEVHVLRAAEFKIRRAGYDVRTAGDVEEAWLLIEAQKPDILITDWQMPRLDGFALVKRIRRNPATRHIPVLVLTAKGFELSLEELSREWNVMGLIAKPFSPRELLETVRGILDRQTAAALTTTA